MDVNCISFSVSYVLYAYLYCVSERVRVCVSDLLCVPGQILQQCLQLITYQFDQSTFNVVVGHVNHKDVGRRIRRLVVLCEKKSAGDAN